MVTCSCAPNRTTVHHFFDTIAKLIGHQSSKDLASDSRAFRLAALSLLLPGDDRGADVQLKVRGAVSETALSAEAVRFVPALMVYHHAQRGRD